MRRADRLFRIVQILRRRKVTTARQLAEELEISERTVYRDVQDLVASGVPIEGEPGVGYALPRSFELPPLMFTREEVTALVLGARVVKAWGDASLAEAADHALSKIEAALPDPLKQQLVNTALFAPECHGNPLREAAAAMLGPLRRAVDDRRKVHMHYIDRESVLTTRIIRPLGLFFWGSVWSVAAWCELRQDFRTFNLDRIQRITLLDERFEPEAEKELVDFLRRRNRPASSPAA